MFLILVASAFFTSIISAIAGMGGGTMLISIMAMALPPAAVIPVHGIVQLGSNFSRALFSFKSIKPSFTIAFIFGAVIGGVVGTQIVVKDPSKYYLVFLGVFILFVTWMPKLKGIPPFKGKFILLGYVLILLSLFAGAVGVFAAPFYLRENLKKEQMIATLASTQVITHLTKILVFSFAGFAFYQYWQLILCMVIGVFAGSYCGKLLLGRLNQRVFMIIYKTMITLLAIELIFVNLF